MSKHGTKIVLSIATILLIAAGISASTPAYTVLGSPSPGGNLLIGELPPGEGFASLVVDEDGKTYRVHLIASEYDDSGEGQITMQLDGGPGEEPDFEPEGPIRLCTARGPSVRIDFTANGDDPYENDFPGEAPLNGIFCGTAYGMAVAIDGCQADIEFHGYVHSDYPFVTYMGMMTTDVKFKGDDNEIEITIFTPKEEIELKGTVEGDVVMDTCGG